ncbi:GGDEF domain-containing protein [Eubacteriales bacterium OttesenSCG-928-M02]|nr:GGDEF domain-containing protein [Eubacteriales bacterium OttesenSCG-928-M02]
MQRYINYVRSHFDSWEEICINDRARLRLSLVLFTFIVSVIFVGLSVFTAIMSGISSALPSIAFGIVTIFLFIWQFHNKEYNIVIAWIFGLLSLAIAAFFIIVEGLESTGHIWICILPIIGTMILPFKQTFIYNGLLLVFLMFLLKNPLHSHIPDEFSPHIRIIFLVSILALTLCNYLSEYIRRRTQRQLQLMTEKYRNSSFTDPLTGAYNRRALNAHFGGPEESSYGLSFAMLDIDFFKKVNDTYGHEVGDKLLRHLVSLVKKCIPPGAQLYRWGGEEFLLVIKSSSANTLRNILENIRKKVMETPLLAPSIEGENPIKLSMTISSGGIVASQNDNLESNIKSADELMYVAKSSGRNKVVVESQPQNENN